MVSSERSDEQSESKVVKFLSRAQGADFEVTRSDLNPRPEFFGKGSTTRSPSSALSHLFFGGDSVSLLKWNTEERYPYSNLSTGGPSCLRIFVLFS